MRAAFRNTERQHVRGHALLEATLIVPVFAFVMLGLVQLATLASASMQAQRFAGQAALVQASGKTRFLEERVLRMWLAIDPDTRCQRSGRQVSCLLPNQRIEVVRQQKALLQPVVVTGRSVLNIPVAAEASGYAIWPGGLF